MTKNRTPSSYEKIDKEENHTELQINIFKSKYRQTSLFYFLFLNSTSILFKKLKKALFCFRMMRQKSPPEGMN